MVTGGVAPIASLQTEGFMFARLKYGCLLVLLGLASCKVVLVETDCLKVVASEVTQDGKLISINTVRFVTDKNCKKMTKVSYIAYRDINGKPGYQTEPEPADLLEKFVAGDISGQSSSKVSISNISNKGEDGGYADAWEIRVENESGQESVFSGSF
jgi:hypothetical protein